jgi:uncharacterized protein YjbI with pentapeptide repeats
MKVQQRCANGELAGGEIGDLDVEVKWSCPCEEVCPGGDGCILETEVMTAEELLERYAAGERDFSGVDLMGINLSGADLGADWSSFNLGGNLNETNLSGANLSSANLSGANLSVAMLYEADLSCANLSYANLNGAALIGANLTGANLSNADLSEASLGQAKFTSCNFRGTRLVHASWGRNLTDVDLSGSIGFFCGLLDDVTVCNITLPDGSIIREKVTWE